jgi:hypothetical protein
MILGIVLDTVQAAKRRLNSSVMQLGDTAVRLVKLHLWDITRDHELTGRFLLNFFNAHPRGSFQ